MKAAVSVLGVQTPTSRFGKETDGHQYPQIATWRCNLTGLSQRTNLFFIAHTEAIYVYKPIFPSQALPPTPILTIETPPSRPGLEGTLDPGSPRAINYLVLQDLGLEEILAVARDDGDVEVYLVAHVVRAVERRTAGEEFPAELRPFFQRNVGLSAWGLAVHSQARVLAASSNTHNVTIFKFGLVDEDGDDDETRRQDATHGIVNGTTNIPSIAFCNTGDDPDCRWLMTTDIVGETRAIDLHSMQVVQKFSFLDDMQQLRHDPNNAGWGLIFLDKRSFIPAKDMQSALGPMHGKVNYNDKKLWNTGPSTTHDWEFSEETAGDSTEEGPYEMDTDSAEEEDEEDVILSYKPSTRFLFRNYPSRQNPSLPFTGGALDCPILHTSVQNAYLLQPSNSDPVISCSELLHQILPSNLYWLHRFARLNLHAYIPSIGVVVVASQMGRAAILSLTKLSGEEVYTMRVDAIVPFKEQEERGERPCMPLAGIAVGCIQGTEKLELGRRRWRLMMTYCDHTVLSFEIRRRGRTGGEEGEVGVQDIVV
ncbi:uncharacterized protein RCC_04659 [Ramularia collo-cygni]|uniref:Uncharacterized protein n=1 Tax=Ramularia collo-cygni TaxID=112498 RepID=A0A2D3UWY2_9PEZI|nr:uncharacterized protein RCC_04659 [Ramularia collo-cygni]CZT18815.1 uncharacterized protein RCC_04659 [Ramularia collo-cygni]